MSHSHSLWDWPIEDSGPPLQRAERQPHALALAPRAVGYLDLFRGSSDEHIAWQYIKALRELGETRRLEFDAPSRLLITCRQGRAPDLLGAVLAYPLSS